MGRLMAGSQEQKAAALGELLRRGNQVRVSATERLRFGNLQLSLFRFVGRRQQRRHIFQIGCFACVLRYGIAQGRCVCTTLAFHICTNRTAFSRKQVCLYHSFLDCQERTVRSSQPMNQRRLWINNIEHCPLIGRFWALSSRVLVETTRSFTVHASCDICDQALGARS